MHAGALNRPLDEAGPSGSALDGAQHNPSPRASHALLQILDFLYFPPDGVSHPRTADIWVDILCTRAFHVLFFFLAVPPDVVPRARDLPLYHSSNPSCCKDSSFYILNLLRHRRTPAPPLFLPMRCQEHSPPPAVMNKGPGGWEGTTPS